MKKRREREAVEKLVSGCVREGKNLTCKAVAVLKMETVLAVQTRRRLASFEKAGGEDM